MKDLPPEIIHANPYEVLNMPDELKIIQDNWMIPAEKFIWICPEYNGSYPGIVKLFIDALSVRYYSETFAFKKSALIGVTKGRSGNIRGLDHLADVLIFMKSVIYPRLLPISRVNDLLDDKGQIIHTPTLQVIDDHVRGFLIF
jgi:NAD(P)H-dependent FMN reductase